MNCIHVAEEAKQLIELFYNEIRGNGHYDFATAFVQYKLEPDYFIPMIRAKKCALLCVNQILKTQAYSPGTIGGFDWHYYIKLRDEIIKFGNLQPNQDKEHELESFIYYAIGANWNTSWNDCDTKKLIESFLKKDILCK